MIDEAAETERRLASLRDRSGSQDSWDWMNRRRFLGLAGGVATAATGLAVVGCGSAGSQTASSSATVGKQVAGGQLKVAVGGGVGSSSKLDPDTSLHAFPDTAAQQGLFNTPVERTEDFSLARSLAEEIESNSTGDEWTIRLKGEVEFHNGKTLDAEDLMASIRRKINTSGSTSALIFQPFDWQNMKKLDNLTVRIPTHGPYSIMESTLSNYASYITPVDFDPQKPVGTGPFQFVSFDPGRQTVLKKFSNYFGKEAYLDQVTILDIPDDGARANALLSGQVDAITGVPASQIAEVESSGKAIFRSDTAAWRPFSMRTDQAPFNDQRVRQAMRLLVDRQAMIDAALGGEGALGNDMYGASDPLFDHNIPQREVDIEQAKSLLKQAGQENLSFQLTTGPVAPGVVEASEVLVSQASAAGVTVNLRVLSGSEYYTVDPYGYLMGVDYWQPEGFLNYFSQSDGPEAPYNETHFNDPAYNAMYKRALAEVDEEKRRPIVHEMQRVQYDRGGYIIWSFPNYVDAHGSNVVGLIPPEQAKYNLRNFRFDLLSLAS